MPGGAPATSAWRLTAQDVRDDVLQVSFAALEDGVLLLADHAFLQLALDGRCGVCLALVFGRDLLVGRSVLVSGNGVALQAAVALERRLGRFGVLCLRNRRPDQARR